MKHLYYHLNVQRRKYCGMLMNYYLKMLKQGAVGENDGRSLRIQSEKSITLKNQV